MKPKLTIGMATYDDFDGVWFTLQNLIMRFRWHELEEIEFIVVDNAPHLPAGEAVRRYVADITRADVRYVERCLRPCAALAKEQIFKRARADVVIVMDCHILPRIAGLREAYMRLRDPSRKWLLHGPLCGVNLNVTATHMRDAFRCGMYGRWDIDPRGQSTHFPIFEINAHGMGLFACRKEHWPGMNPRFYGVCSEEGYIHRKMRQSGGKVMCLPAMKWVHRHSQHKSPPYHDNEQSLVHLLRNWVLACDELGDPALLDEVVINFLEHQFMDLAKIQGVIHACRNELLTAPGKEPARFDPLLAGNGKPAPKPPGTGEHRPGL